MRYFGVPTCPYCKKRVNLIRTWSLKRQGEYQCPRCGGISNIFLSPLVYVLAMLVIFSGGAMYFFHKFVLDDISLETAIYVFIPFAVFFLLSLFMVYLEKPVIKKVSREEYMKKHHIRSAVDGSAGVAQRPESRPEPRRNIDDDSHLPRASHRPGPVHEPQRQGVVNQAAFSRAKLQAAVENTQQSGRLAHPVQAPRPAQGQRPVQSQRPAQVRQPVQSQYPVQGQYPAQVQHQVPSQYQVQGQQPMRAPQQAQPPQQVRDPRLIQNPQPRQQRPVDPAAVQGVRPRQPAVRPAAAPSGQVQRTGNGGYPPVQPVPQRRPQGQNTVPRRDIE